MWPVVLTVRVVPTQGKPVGENELVLRVWEKPSSSVDIVSMMDASR